MRHTWTHDEIEWLKINIKQYSYKNIQSAFNEHFKTNLSANAIEKACARNGISHGRKNEHGFVKNEHNSFSVTSPIGAEYTDSRGRVYIKISDKAVFSHSDRKGYRGENWKQKDRYVWENSYGKLSKNDLLIHLNSDKSDCSLENLYKTNRAVNVLLAANNWYFLDRNMTLTAIKCSELIVALSKSQKLR